MDWFRAVNGYCERTDASYWSEPLNAVSQRRVPDRRRALLADRPPATAAPGSSSSSSPRSASAPTSSTPTRRSGRCSPTCCRSRPSSSSTSTSRPSASSPRRAWAGLAAAVGLRAAERRSSARRSRRSFGPLNGSVGYMPVVLLIVAYAARARPPRPGDRARHGDRRRRSSRCRSSSAPSTTRSAPRFPLGTHFLWHAAERRDARLDDLRARPARPRRGAGARSCGRGPRAKAGPTSPEGPCRMSIDKDTARRVAHLARIEVAEAELGAAGRASSRRSSASWSSCARSTSTGVEPMTSVTPMRLPWREDVVTDGGIPDKVLAERPRRPRRLLHRAEGGRVTALGGLTIAEARDAPALGRARRGRADRGEPRRRRGVRRAQRLLGADPRARALPGEPRRGAAEGRATRPTSAASRSGSRTSSASRTRRPRPPRASSRASARPTRAR